MTVSGQIELGHASDTTLARSGSGVVTIEGAEIRTGTVAVANGGTGATSLTDGGILLGSGTGAITAMTALADGEMIVGDGSGDPVAESGATLRTSIGVGTTDSPQFAGLTVTGSITQGGWELGSMPPVKLIHSDLGAPFTFPNFSALDIERLEKLANYFSLKTALTEDESKSLFNSNSAAASTTNTIAEAAASNRTGGFSNSQKPHFLTGNWSGAEDIGSQSVLTNLGINSQRLIIFGGNTYTGGGTDAITFSLAAGGDTFDDDASMIIISGAGNDIYSSYIKGGTNDNSVDLTLTPAELLQQ